MATFAEFCGSSTINYFVAMENMGLNRRTDAKAGGAVVYAIRDPKVVFAIENGIEINRS